MNTLNSLSKKSGAIQPRQLVPALPTVLLEDQDAPFCLTVQKLRVPLTNEYVILNWKIVKRFVIKPDE
jgi:hypothetical protein